MTLTRLHQKSVEIYRSAGMKLKASERWMAKNCIELISIKLKRRVCNCYCFIVKASETWWTKNFIGELEIRWLSRCCDSFKGIRCRFWLHRNFFFSKLRDIELKKHGRISYLFKDHMGNSLIFAASVNFLRSILSAVKFVALIHLLFFSYLQSNILLTKWVQN